ncbi:MAG: hypothetical protein IJS76_05690 [Pseudobutyrivibrio sp.]|jgi:hypothetical protein|nr:hypothetical protein [Pseudobutyrivibrio sp.]
MITFKKKTLSQDLMPKAIEQLKKEGVSFNLISPEQADAASKVNSKAMVLMSFIKNDKGFYQIIVKDKEFYTYTRKFLGDPEYCRMRITDTNKKERTVTAETDHLGIALDVIEVLGIKYNLSIVEE